VERPGTQAPCPKASVDLLDAERQHTIIRDRRGDRPEMRYAGREGIEGGGHRVLRLFSFSLCSCICLGWSTLSGAFDGLWGNGMTQTDSDDVGFSAQTFRQILSAAKAMSVYYDTDRTAGDLFHRNYAHGLSLRYREEGRTAFEYACLALALRQFCSPIATRQFYDSVSNDGIPMPYTIEADGSFHEDGKLYPLPTIDFYSVACEQRETGAMEPLSGPFIGAAGDLWDAGMDGLPETDPIVVRSREQLWGGLLGDHEKVVHLKG
jgi:hypothetical protein